ncbi:MAG TPA: NAD(P)H-hydrate dehydratase [Acidiferrobacter sp.]|nr:NAD(P)H-hydrate dehydratase [Acidiferrobacter sp.]
MAAWIARSIASSLSVQVLDERMADGLCGAITRYFPSARRIALLVGGGGNGRQARALAHRYRETGIKTTLIFPGGDEDLESLRCHDVLVDGLIGTGLHGPLADGYRRLVDLARASRRPIVAIDGPAGLDLSKGAAVAGALRANYTLFCGQPKIGALTGAGREFCGALATIDLGIPTPPSTACAVVPDCAEIAALVPVRARHAHKEEAGVVAILGGDVDMPGAVQLAALAAYRVGAGLVIGCVHARNITRLAANLPELIAAEAPGTGMPLQRAHWLLVGSGLGRSEWGGQVWAAAQASDKPLLVDGDGLYWLSREPRRRTDWILTPHEGEAARLLGVTRPDVAADRLGAGRELQSRYGGVCVLKGAGTLIVSTEATWLCPFGHSGMATAGMGDALAGVIVSLAVQGSTATAAARLGVFLHAQAGDRAAITVGSRGLVTSDLIACLPHTLTALC